MKEHFCENSKLSLATNHFRKKRSTIDVPLGSKYASELNIRLNKQLNEK